MTALPATTDDASQRLQCMEVWGGNQATETALTMVGLDTWVYSRPYGTDEHGGDLHSISSCSSGRITRMLVADVTGHGSPVAHISTRLRSLLHRYINHIDPTALVQAMNVDFRRQQELSIFATATLATYFAPARRLTVCNAGHPPPLLYRAATDSWHFLSSQYDRHDPDSAVGDSSDTPDGASQEPSNLPLGIFESARYDRRDLVLEIDDMVLFYTDGLIEAQDNRGEMLDMDGLLQLLRNLRGVDAAQVVPELLAAVEAWTGSGTLQDDLTLMVARCNERPTRLQDDLLAPLRFVRHMLEHRVGRGGSIVSRNRSAANTPSGTAGEEPLRENP